MSSFCSFSVVIFHYTHYERNTLCVGYVNITYFYVVVVTFSITLIVFSEKINKLRISEIKIISIKFMGLNFTVKPFL